MNTDNIPLTEFDPDRNAIIEPALRPKEMRLPEYCIMPFLPELLKNLEAAGATRKIHTIKHRFWTDTDLYQLEHRGKKVLVVLPGFGASNVVMIFERLIAWGSTKFVACGFCGVLRPELKDGHIIIPATALRDEGASYHYLPPSRIVAMDSAVVKKLEAVLENHHIKYAAGLVWTTDAAYRETKGKVARRAAEGCLAVEMECAAFLAVAKFRNVLFGQYLTASDDVSGDEWDLDADRSLSVQEKLFRLSVEACVSL